ncbi:MAG: hypothetical protein ACOYKZ_03405 [Chlamydiia bacterium]
MISFNQNGLNECACRGIRDVWQNKTTVAIGAGVAGCVGAFFFGAALLPLTAGALVYTTLNSIGDRIIKAIPDVTSVEQIPSFLQTHKKATSVALMALAMTAGVVVYCALGGASFALGPVVIASVICATLDKLLGPKLWKFVQDRLQLNQRESPAVEQLSKVASLYAGRLMVSAVLFSVGTGLGAAALATWALCMSRGLAGALQENVKSL